MTHKFNTEVAKEVGIVGAILYDNIQFWCDKNEANNKNFHDNLFWTYNTVKAWQKLFPYMGKKQIENGLKKLEEFGYIATGNYSETGYDRTKWYSDIKKYESTFPILPKGEMDSPKRGNRFTQKGNTITDNKPDNKPDTTKEVKKERANKSRYEQFIIDLKERVVMPSKVTLTKTGKDLFKNIDDPEDLTSDYLLHQSQKGEFAKRITAYMEDYIANGSISNIAPAVSW